MPTVADETYDPARIERLRDLLRALARRIVVLDAEGRLLADPSALLRALGDVRSELFRYEVRTTFDTPESAEHRRIVGEAKGGWSLAEEPDEEDDAWPPDGR
ncbi:MAG: hypothetical protein A2083_03590 [Gemmatimonadetes bacterium GWC2_71_9]|nr:MAG: hypothetical protein A2083_03590 [Gemmatimonadetes bacterium GWC2_71_9]OGT96162.1 MAG: hypothetical protein A3I79_04455 [Gemmatimonadetes bacterium RIFCSPLOWO2_02_FULL_71_11]